MVVVAVPAAPAAVHVRLARVIVVVDRRKASRRPQQDVVASAVVVRVAPAGGA